jgi:hypothetical protein
VIKETDMSTDEIETDRDTDVAAMPDRQTIERKGNGVPAPAANPTVRPWTADFLLPSISFHRSKHA